MSRLIGRKLLMSRGPARCKSCAPVSTTRFRVALKSDRLLDAFDCISADGHSLMDAAPEPFLLLEARAGTTAGGGAGTTADRGASSLAAFANPGRRGNSRYRHSGALGSLAGERTVRPLGDAGLGGSCYPSSLMWTAPEVASAICSAGTVL